MDGYKSFKQGKALKMRCHYAVEFGNQEIETDEGEERVSKIRGNFNSPFRLFVLATTSIGQEGLDSHQYCRRIVHWNLPGNPIDLEQREGRINRYKGLVIRQQPARRYGGSLRTQTDDIRIERLVPMYPCSEDGQQLERTPDTLAIYRLAFGQPRQAELVEHRLARNPGRKEIEAVRKGLMIDLSPIVHQECHPHVGTNPALPQSGGKNHAG